MASVDPEDLKLPQAPILKLMKQGAGEGVNFSNEAKVATARAAAVFCLHAADLASDISAKAKRKTVTANDIIEAMDKLNVPEFKQLISDTVDEYRTVKSTKGKKK